MLLYLSVGSIKYAQFLRDKIVLKNFRKARFVYVYTCTLLYSLYVRLISDQMNVAIEYFDTNPVIDFNSFDSDAL